MTMRYSIELAKRLRSHLFHSRVFRDAKGRYDPRDERREAVARETWAVHGICLKCRCWTIMVGVCKECGEVYSETRLASHVGEMMVRKQLEAADKELREHAN
jgi:hypothetical protein